MRVDLAPSPIVSMAIELLRTPSRFIQDRPQLFDSSLRPSLQHQGNNAGHDSGRYARALQQVEAIRFPDDNGFAFTATSRCEGSRDELTWRRDVWLEASPILAPRRPTSREPAQLSAADRSLAHWIYLLVSSSIDRGPLAARYVRTDSEHVPSVRRKTYCTPIIDRDPRRRLEESCSKGGTSERIERSVAGNLDPPSRVHLGPIVVLVTYEENQVPGTGFQNSCSRFNGAKPRSTHVECLHNRALPKD